MSTIVALAANAMMSRGPYVLGQPDGIYLKVEPLKPRGMLGLRPAPVFSRVSKREEATQYATWLGAWYHRQALERSAPHMQRVSIERMPKA